MIIGNTEKIYMLLEKAKLKLKLKEEDKKSLETLLEFYKTHQAEDVFLETAKAMLRSITIKKEFLIQCYLDNEKFKVKIKPKYKKIIEEAIKIDS